MIQPASLHVEAFQTASMIVFFSLLLGISGWTNNNRGFVCNFFSCHLDFSKHVSSILFLCTFFVNAFL